jgi:1-deoxy-D-xylulose-5-phosphate reductoisomerase
MRLPIQYAITYPDRLDCPADELDFFAMKDLTFAPADPDTFLCLKAAMEAIDKGGLYPCAVNGANERAVQLFLDDKIEFADIGRIVYRVLSEFEFGDDYTLDEVFETDRKARAFVDAQLLK